MTAKVRNIKTYLKYFFIVNVAYLFIKLKEGREAINRFESKTNSVGFTRLHRKYIFLFKAVFKVRKKFTANENFNNNL